MAPPLRDGERTRARHRPVFLQVGLVAHDDEGDALVVFYAHDLLAQFVQLVEAAEACDGEDEEEALTRFHVELSRRMSELFCGGVDNRIPHCSCVCVSQGTGAVG